MKAKLAADVYSNFCGRVEIPDPKAKGGVRIEHGPMPYGKRNEEVMVISDRDNVLIVENKQGNRYPVKRQDVIIQSQ